MQEIPLSRRESIGFYIMTALAGIGWAAGFAALCFWLGYLS